MKFCCVIVLACLLQGAFSQVPVERACPAYSAQSGFNQASLNGVWYIAEQVPWTETITITCASLGFTYSPFSLKLGGYFTGTSNDVDRAIPVTDLGAGKFSMTIQGAAIEVTVVAATANYMALYSCVNTDTNLSIDMAWILTKSQARNQNDITSARDALARAGLNLANLRSMNQENCTQ